MTDLDRTAEELKVSME